MDAGLITFQAGSSFDGTKAWHFMRLGCQAVGCFCWFVECPFTLQIFFFGGDWTLDVTWQVATTGYFLLLEVSQHARNP